MPQGEVEVVSCEEGVLSATAGPVAEATVATPKRKSRSMAFDFKFKHTVVLQGSN